MGSTSVMCIGAALACLAAGIAAPEPLAAAQTVATLNVPPVCVVDAVGQSTTVTMEMCGFMVPAGITLSPALPRAYETGTHKLTWSGITDTGLRMSETQTLIVMDLTPPDVTPPPASLDHEATAAKTPLDSSDYGVAKATDRLAGTLTPTSDATDTFSVGSHTLTWTATDRATGLTATATQVISVVDTESPTITCSDDLRIKSPVSVPLSSARLGVESATDRVDGPLTPTNNAPDPLPHGKATKVKYTAMDSSGNTDTCSHLVYVSTPSTIATLPTKIGVDGRTFGSALAFSGDILFVGNPGHVGEPASTETPAPSSESLLNSGIVTAYGPQGMNGEYKAQYEIEPETAAENLYFGEALAVISASPHDILAVGARGKGGNIGEVALYNAATGKFMTTIANPNEADENKDQFGAALAAMGDKLVVGAHTYNEPAICDEDDSERDAGSSEDDEPATCDEDSTRQAGRVYVFDSGGTKQYEIPSYSPATYGRFGIQVAAADGDTKRIYVGANTNAEKSKGAVYIYDVTKASSTIKPDDPDTALRPSGTGLTGFGIEQIRPADDGGVYVGEPGTRIRHVGKIHQYSPTGSHGGEFVPQDCCKRSFGKSFDIDDRLLYTGAHKPGDVHPLQAFALSNRAYAEQFRDSIDLPTGYYVTRFGLEIESSGDGKVAVLENMEKWENGDLKYKTRVRLLDLSTLVPTFSYTPPPTPSPPPGTTVVDHFGDAAFATASVVLPTPRPTVAPAPSTPLDPRLLTTELLEAGKIKLTYNAAIDPFEVDLDDYVMTDRALEIVAVETSGSTVTLTYEGSTATASTGTPGVELIGGIGYY